MTDVLKGRLLVATPNLGDPNFERTVVLILDHGDDGALGVVLNRPSEMDLAEPLPEWARAAAHPSVLFIGGPVAPSAAVCLARVTATAAPGSAANGWEADGWRAVLGPVGTMDLDSDPDEAIPRLEEIRVFAGYAGWGPGQLESEIDEGGWFVVDADVSDPLSPAPERLWAAVLRRQRGTLALFAAYPADPSLN
ncbi:MAG: YqgE/AlgH family protein [Actinomycetota bacterium]|nr:YqgE/AlgH family protein [Actinomycetota bacterium]